MKRVYLSKKDKKILGLCGGISQAYDIDPAIVRLMTIFLCISTGIIPLLLTYLAGGLIVPQEPTE